MQMHSQSLRTQDMFKGTPAFILAGAHRRNEALMRLRKTPPEPVFPGRAGRSEDDLMPARSKIGGRAGATVCPDGNARNPVRSHRPARAGFPGCFVLRDVEAFH